MQILKTKEECDHVQFLITETSGLAKIQHPDIEEIETLSLGQLEHFFHYQMKYEKYFRA